MYVMDNENKFNLPHLPRKLKNQRIPHGT